MPKKYNKKQTIFLWKLLKNKISLKSNKIKHLYKKLQTSMNMYKKVFQCLCLYQISTKNTYLYQKI